MRNGSARDACLPDFTEQGLLRSSSHPRLVLALTGHSIRYHHWLWADHRPLLAELALRLLWDLAAEQVSFARQHSPESVPDASLLLQIQKFLWLQEQNQGHQQGLRHFVLSEPHCSTCCTSREGEGEAGAQKPASSCSPAMSKAGITMQGS